MYRALRRRFGPGGWWPAETPLEVCVGAILTQNTSWNNVERAIEALRRANALDWDSLSALPIARLERLIRPSGTYRVKARRLVAFLRFVREGYGGRVEAMASEKPGRLRRRLLRVHGIGPETADCIVLYAAGLPVFVVDAYTRRIAARLGLVPADIGYGALQQLFMDGLPPDAGLFNDFHAQLVRLAKEHCRRVPVCGGCPLERRCPRVGVIVGGVMVR